MTGPRGIVDIGGHASWHQSAQRSEPDGRQRNGALACDNQVCPVAVCEHIHDSGILTGTVAREGRKSS